jgi:PLAT/LH2 domain
MNRSYKVEVRTGQREKAGTDARVWVQLVGVNGLTSEIRLDTPNHDDFEKGHTETFQRADRDVGWVNKIRLLHDNSNDQPGWYIDYVKLSFLDLGLDVQADFYRWLATTTGDGQIDVTKDVNVGAIALSSGVLERSYLGYQIRRVKNDGVAPFHTSQVFSYEYMEGLSLSLANSRTVSGSAKLSASFFGIGSSFEGEVTSQTTKTLACEARQTFRTEVEVSADVTPGTATTYVALFYQDLVRGDAVGCGIEVPFERRFSITYDPVAFDGWLSDSDVEKQVCELLAATLGQPVARHPAAKTMDIRFATRELVGPFTASNIAKSMRAQRVGVLKKELFAGTTGARLVEASGRRIYRM